MKEFSQCLNFPFDTPQLSLTGQVNHIHFHSEETGFTVFTLEVEKLGRVKVVGYTPTIKEGEYVKAKGEWRQNPQYGKQFQASFLRFEPPMTEEAIEAYLGSGMVKGVGKWCAKQLVEAFGDKVFDVIEHNPEALLKVEGIGKTRMKKICANWAEQTAVRNIMIFLNGFGVSTVKAVRIYKVYGDRAIDIVRNNPYRLIEDVDGISFKSADKIAQSIGIDPTSQVRARAGIHFTLNQAALSGHCYLPKSRLIEEACELLEIPEDNICRSVDAEIKARHLIVNDEPEPESVFPIKMDRAERLVTYQIFNLMNGSLPWSPIDYDKAVRFAEERLEVSLSGSQKEAIQTAIQSKVMVITGGPGVGKTTLVKSIIEILGQTTGLKMALCAPTGRAAKRMAETSGYPASTVHRLLGVDKETGGFKHDENNLLDCDLLIVDECSMLDIFLAASLLKALPRSCAVIFVGDVDQLPPVGPGAFLKDLIDSQVVPVIRLTEIFRQAASSWIVRVAHQINAGIVPHFSDERNKDCLFIQAEEPEEISDRIMTLATKNIPELFHADPKKDVQILSPMHKGITGVKALNDRLQVLLNPPGEHSVTKYGMTYSVGDKVMQTINNYEREVFNGDVGYVEKLDDIEAELTVNFEGHRVVYPYSELDELKLCYATSIHKSQGSEYPVVIIPVSTQHYVMLRRNLLYTGVTRGKKLVVLVGQKQALAIAVSNSRLVPRLTGLMKRLQRMNESFELSQEYFG